MRRLTLTAALAIASITLGCGSNEETTPAACLRGPIVLSKALAEAPGHVRLPGGVPISDCLTPNQSGGDLTEVGAVLVAVTTGRNIRARQDPGGAANVELGYLVGAAKRGAAETAGIHAELVRRLEAAARFSPGGQPLPGAFKRAYEKGYAAGRNDG